MLRKRHAVAISEIHLLDQWFAGFLWGKISEKDGVCCTRRKGENP
jgi:hypothetical protein